MMYWGWGMPLIGMLLMTLFWVAIVAGFVWLLTRAFGRGSHYSNPPNWTPGPGAPAAQNETPLDIARRRYASGEITKAEYEQIRQDLTVDQR